MRRAIVTAAALLLSAALVAAKNGTDLLQKALELERGKGDLDAAVHIYQRIVGEFASDQSSAARALFQLGRIQELRGQDEALKSYERLIKDYPGQTDVGSQAVARLNGLRSRMEFVKIAPGTFQMGCSTGDSECPDQEKPAHEVRITKGFEMGKTEVTQRQWQAVMGTNPSEFKGDNLPVERVSWNDAKDFLKKVNEWRDGYRYRLPTEAEWEYAARAGTSGPYAGSLDAMGWYRGNSGGKTHPVGQKQANAWGLYDMHGNVWEWLEDWLDTGYYGASPAIDPQGPSSGTRKVLRGGAWHNDTWGGRVSMLH